jgi:hypothetical protein
MSASPCDPLKKIFTAPHLKPLHTPSIITSHLSRMSTPRDAPLLMDGTNYPAWLFLMRAKLNKIGALNIVRGIVKRPVNTEDAPAKPKVLAKHNKLNHVAYIEIIEHLEAGNLDHVAQTIADANLSCRYLVWRLLKEKYAGDNYIAKDTALERFLDLEYHDSPSQLIAEVCTANQRLISAKVGLNDQVKTSILLRKLPPSYQLFRDVISVGCINDTVPMVLACLEKHVLQNHLD